MPTLSTCIRKAGKALSTEDAAAIKEIQREYIGDGMQSSEAAIKAIDDHLGVMAEERADTLDQLREQGGDTSPYTGGVRDSLLQQQRGDSLRQLRQAAATADTARETAAAELRAKESDRLKQPQVRYGFNQEDIDAANKDPKAAESVGMKQLETMEEMAQKSDGTKVYPLLRGASNLRDKSNRAGRAVTVSMTPTRDLSKFAPESMRETSERINYLNKRMVGRESQLVNNVGKTIDPWIKLKKDNREMSDMMTGIMHRATLAQVDPSEVYKPRADIAKNQKRIRALKDALSTNAKAPGKIRTELRAREATLLAEEKRKSDHNRLSAFFNNELNEDARKVYHDVREMFKQQYDQLQTSMDARIEALDADGKTKQTLRAMTEKTFEQGKIDPYFPLSRYGDYWAVAKNADGEILAYSQFENVEDQKDWVRNWKRTGANVKSGVDTKAGKQGVGPKMASIDPGFTLDVVKGIGDLGAQSKETTELIDDIWQTYLRSLPEMSARKQFLHRKGVQGFTADGLRAVADATLRNARRIAKVEYQFQIENELTKLDKQAHAEEADPWAQQVADEIRQRHEHHMNHESAAWASTLTSLGFHWFLGILRPSAAIVNLTQTALVGMPVLSAFNLGHKGSAFAELSIAAKDVTTLFKFGKDPFADPASNKRFSEGDKKAIHDIEEKFALFDKTRTHDLLGIQDAGGDYATSKMKHLGEISGWLFHNTEVFNRKVTALAAYRLAIKQGMKHDAAVYKAVQLTEDSHFDYGSQNRPKIMQSDAARVALLFRNYSVNMYTFLIRNFHDSLKVSGGSKKERQQAAVRFYGSMGMTTAMAGATGWPIIWSLMQAADMIIELFDDDEIEDYRALMNPKDRMRLWVQDTFGDVWGEEAAALIMDGALDAIPFIINENTDLNVPNPTFSTRLTLANVAFQDAPADAPVGSGEWIAHYAGEAMGPSLGLIQDWGQGAYDIAGGNNRGIENLTPSSVTDMLKTYRYMMEGVKTKTGMTVVGKEDLTASDYATAGIGFGPYTVTRQYTENNARRYVDQRINLRREYLANNYKNSLRADRDTTDIMSEISDFNGNYPEYMINVGRLTRSELLKDVRGMDGMAGVSRRRQLLLDQIQFTKDKKQ